MQEFVNSVAAHIAEADEVSVPTGAVSAGTGAVLQQLCRLYTLYHATRNASDFLRVSYYN